MPVAKEAGSDRTNAGRGGFPCRVAPRSRPAGERGFPPTSRQWRAVLLTAALGLLALAEAAWPIDRLPDPQPDATPSSETRRPLPVSRVGRPGPWGSLRYTRIFTEMPDRLVSLEELASRLPVRWFFGGHSPAMWENLVRSADVTDSQRQDLLDERHWEVSDTGLWVTPNPDVVLGLSKAARQKIYAVLSRYPENQSRTESHAYYPEFLDERIRNSRLAPASIELFKSLLYPQGNFLIFGDLTTALSRLPDDEERTRFTKMVSRRASLLVKLQIRPDSDVAALSEYWGAGGRAKDLRALLTSLANVPEGCNVDIAHLLPPLVRERLYTYPGGVDSRGAESPNCHWTTMNFFRTVPDDRFLDSLYTAEYLRTRYDRVETASRLGDVILLRHDDAGGVFHSAVHIADDVVFTKNGAQPTQPWIFMRMDDMLEIYSGYLPAQTPVQVIVLRARDPVP